MKVATATRSGITGREQPVFDRVAELERQLREAQAELERQRERKTAAQRRWRERHPEVARRINREANRAWRARRRQGLSSGGAPPDRSRPQPEAHNSAPELAEQQLRRERKAAYMREWRARRRQNPG